MFGSVRLNRVTPDEAVLLVVPEGQRWLLFTGHMGDAAGWVRMHIHGRRGLQVTGVASHLWGARPDRLFVCGSVSRRVEDELRVVLARMEFSRPRVLEGEAHLVRVDWEQENEPRCTALMRPPMLMWFANGLVLPLADGVELDVEDHGVDSMRYLLNALVPPLPRVRSNTEVMLERYGGGRDGY